MIIDVILLGWRADAPVATAVDVVLGVGGPMGEAAVQSIGFGWAGAFEAEEELGGVTHDGDATYRTCKWSVRSAPAADATFVLLKNGAPFQTVTVPAGETNGVETLGGGDVADRDRLDWIAPIVPDPALRDFSPTLSSDAA